MDTYTLAKLILAALVVLIAVVCILIAINDSTNQKSSNVIRYYQNGNSSNDSKGNKYIRYNGK